MEHLLRTSLGALIAPVLTVLLLLSGAARATDCSIIDIEARKLVETMSHSLREQNYKGIFTYQYGSTIESLSIEHTVVDGVENETLMHLSGHRRTVVRRAHPLNCVHPGHRLLQIGGSLKDNCGFATHYQLKVTGRERLAGRQAVRLRVSPRDMYRYGYLLAVDEISGLLLKSQIMGHDGQILERFEFADLNIGATPSLEDLETPSHVAHHPRTGASGGESDSSGWSIEWLPSGFLRTELDAEQLGYVRTYTDGLAVFSVFLEARGSDGAAPVGGEGSAMQGATTAYTRSVSSGKRAWLVTVIGEVPVNTARRVAESVGIAG
ncbi:MAG: sigma-E factor negative regulatory protein RseB [Halieaceae bacterium]